MKPDHKQSTKAKEIVDKALRAAVAEVGALPASGYGNATGAIGDDAVELVAELAGRYCAGHSSRRMTGPEILADVVPMTAEEEMFDHECSVSDAGTGCAGCDYLQEKARGRRNGASE